MGAKNRVINGEYAGSLVVGGGSSNAGISLGFLKQLRLISPKLFFGKELYIIPHHMPESPASAIFQIHEVTESG